MDLLIPYAISYIVSPFREKNEESSLLRGFILFEVSGTLFIVTEFMAIKFFRSLVEAVVGIKNSMLSNMTKIRVEKGEVPEDLVGRVASDIDFVVWNINALGSDNKAGEDPRALENINVKNSMA